MGSKGKSKKAPSSRAALVSDKPTDEKTPSDQEKEVKVKNTKKRLEDIPGIGPKTAAKLRDLGYSFIGLATARADIVAAEMGASCSYMTALAWVKTAQEAVLSIMTPKTGRQVSRERRLKRVFFETGSKEFNRITGGGFATMRTTGLAGRFSTGKTQAIYDGIVHCLDENNNKYAYCGLCGHLHDKLVTTCSSCGAEMKRKAAYIETEPDCWSDVRVEEMAKAQKINVDLDDVWVFECENIPTAKAQYLQYKIIQKLIQKKNENIGYIGVDSMTAKFRPGYSRTEMLPVRTREFTEHFLLMDYLAAKHNIAWVLSCQVIGGVRPGAIKALIMKTGDKQGYYPVGGDYLLHCYDEQTEVLTDNGWKFFKDLKDSDYIGCLEDNHLVYRKPRERQVYSYKGTMIKFSGKSGDLLVTPKHQLLIRSDKNKNWRFKRAETFVGLTKAGIQHYETLRTCKWVGINKEEFVFNGFTRKWKAGLNHLTNNKKVYPTIRLSTDKYMRLLGWYLSEGTIQEARGIPRVICIRQTKKIKELELDLDYIGLPYRRNGSLYCIDCPQIATQLKPLGKSHEKYIPKEVKNLTVKSLKVLLSRLTYGDGRRDGVYTTTSKQLADDVQEVMIKCGYGTSISEQKSNNGIIHNREIKSSRLIYLVIPSKKNTTPRICKCVEEIPYDGLVFDVTVPGHIILVRRNGRAVWSSNSVSTWVSLSQVKTELYEAVVFDSNYLPRERTTFMLTKEGLMDGVR